MGRPDEIELIRECLDNGIEFAAPYFRMSLLQLIGLVRVTAVDSGSWFFICFSHSLTPLLCLLWWIACDIHSMAETLIRFLGSLAEPVIPSNLYWYAARHSAKFPSSYSALRFVAASLPSYHITDDDMPVCVMCVCPSR